jgi:5-methylcytosine-specific restriction protein A
MSYRVLNDKGGPLDAHLDIDGNEFVFHSRGGKRGDPGARNLDYGPALRLLLHRVAKANRRVLGAWVDSDEVLYLERSHRQILEGEELNGGPDAQFSAMSKNMQAFGRPAGAAYGGSRVKKIRVRIDWTEAERGLADLLGLEDAPTPPRGGGRMPSKLLNAITPEHVWEAVQMLEASDDHPFGEPREFELVADEGVRLPPNAVFGTAARLALGADIPPEHFTGAAEERCHRILEAAGFEIVARGQPSRSAALPLPDEDREWAEGRPKLVLHLRRERAPGLARAKKRAFAREHGHLFCERCGMDPVIVLGSAAGEACIEVHHDRTEVGKMGDGGRTTLADVKCLCANCHRLVHALMREALKTKRAARLR